MKSLVSLREMEVNPMKSLVSLRARKQGPSSGLRSGWFPSAALALVAALLVLAGCASGNTTAKTGNTGNTGNSTNQTGNTTSPTATTASGPHPKPSTVPGITMQFCQSLVSPADVNTVLKSASPADVIEPINSNPGGACSYLDSQTAANVFTMYFQPFPAGTSFSDTTQLALSVAQAEAGVPYGANLSPTPLSGVGDQALFASYAGSTQGGTGFLDDLLATTGGVAISCFSFGPGSPSTPQQPALTQLCTQAINRI